MKLHLALHLFAKCENYIFSNFFSDQMQERNAKEREDRIRIYPSIPLRWDEHQCEDDTK